MYTTYTLGRVVMGFCSKLVCFSFGAYLLRHGGHGRVYAVQVELGWFWLQVYTRGANK